MGCHSYHGIQFSEDDDEFVCLCTFPYNDEAAGERLDPERVRSLALLGAAVVLNRYDGDIGYLPDDLPRWIVDEIVRNVPQED